MTPPRLKVYGLVRLTRRAYLTIQGLGLAVVAVVLVIVAGLPRPEAPKGERLPPFVAALVYFLDRLPWIALAGLLLVAVETAVVLRKFRKLDEQQRALQPAPSASEGTQPPDPSLALRADNPNP